MYLESALKNDRLCKSLVGLSVEEFKRLSLDFDWNYTESRIKEKPERMRVYGGGRTGKLLTKEHKLFFILLYLKIYPTFDVLGWLSGLDRTRAKRWQSILLPILEQTLKRKLVLPERKIRSVEVLLQRFPDLKDIILDGTEREVQRPKNKKRQNKLYSGKKKSQTRKNIIGASPDKKIIILTKTKSGRRHDKRLSDKENLAREIPEEIAVWVDTGFQGMDKDRKNILIPKKRTKRQELTPEDKEENRIISSIRVTGEHAIAGIKRFNCLVHTYRNKSKNLDDKFILIASGLWNYHLGM